MGRLYQVLSAVEFVVVNAVLIALFLFVRADFAARLQYFMAEGFVPRVSYSLLTYVISATRGSTFIPGLTTIDFQQVLALLLAAFDGSFVYSLIRRRATKGP